MSILTSDKPGDRNLTTETSTVDSRSGIGDNTQTEKYHHKSRCTVAIAGHGVDEIRDTNVGSCFPVGDGVGRKLAGGTEYLTKDDRDDHANIDTEEKLPTWSLGGQTGRLQTKTGQRDLSDNKT